MTTRDSVGELPEGVSPLGIKIVCVLGVGGVLLASSGGVAAVARGELLAGGAVVSVLAANLLVYYGLWTVRRWGWYGGVLFEGLGFVIALLSGSVVLAVIQGVVLFVVVRHYDHYLG